MANKGYDYEKDNYWYCNEYNLTLIQETNRKENINMKKCLKIADYKVINDTVVIVTFADGSVQKAVCAPEDTFDINRAIEICVMKQICGGSSEYNTIISKALKDIKNLDKKRIKAAKEAEEKRAIEDRHYAKMQRRKEKRKEKRIAEMTEAYKRALAERDKEKKEKKTN